MNLNENEVTRLIVRKYSDYGGKLNRAVDTVLAGGVKEYRFGPSGRKVFTVVGHLGDEFIDPQKQYCSCSHFFFRVATGRDEICYHLLSYKIASEQGRVDVVAFDDEEYGSLLSAIVKDVFMVLDKSSGSQNPRFS